MTTPRCLACLCLLALATPAVAQTSYPMITHTSPTAVQRGKTSEVAVEGQMNFAGVYQLLCTGKGVSAEVVATPAPKTPAPVRSVKLKVTVAPDAELGVRDFRLASNLGVSSIGQFLVTDDPVITENGDNNTPQKANPIAVPSVVCGRIEIAEDVDFFQFHVEGGQTLTFEVQCARIEDRIHDLQKHADPILTLYDAEGRELAANDDFNFADPLLTYTFPKPGDYQIQVRDSKFDGDPRWVYAMTVTDRPYVTHLYPMAGQPGQKLEVEPVGSARLRKPKLTVEVPKDAGVRQVQLDMDGGKTNPVTLIASPLAQVMEKEPNDTPEEPTRVTIPCGINGRIGKKLDADHFVFAATKGKPIRFEVKARRFGTELRSGLDSFLEILTPKGAAIASNDDTIGKDSTLVFTPPADGDYVLCIRDLHSRGGDHFVYFIEADWEKPDFSLRCDPDKAMIGPGSSTAWYVHVVRTGGFAGPVKVDVKGLPKGVSVNPLTIPATMTQGVLVLTAAADAQLNAANVEIVGTGTVEKETLVRTSQPNSEIYSPGGGRARFDVPMQTVAVTGPSDVLEVKVSRDKVSLKPGEEVMIEVEVKRRSDYAGGVSLSVELQHLGTIFGNPLPPGVTVDTGKSKTLLGNASKGHIVLKADAKAAPIEDVPISVLCHVSINFVVKVSYSSPPILVTVQK